MKRSVDRGGVAPFLSKTYDMVDDVSTESTVSWSQLNNSFVVWDAAEFAKNILPKFFKHSNFSSFVRQLNTYGFRKVDPDRWEFANEGFLRGQKHLLKSISRRKPVQQPPFHDSSSKACVKLGNFGLEEQVESLKRDKNILVYELVRFKKQQQVTDNQLQTVGQRVQLMERRQQQMMSFLGKQMHTPGLLAQLVQHQNEGNRHVAEIGKKRRLSNHGEETTRVESVNGGSSDGRVVKFQPLINEAAKSMLEQILKLKFSDVPFSRARDSKVGLNDSFFAVKNGTLEMGTENSSPDVGFDVLLPESNDAFWEQFFPVSPLCEVVDSSTCEVDIVEECESGQHEEWKSRHQVNHLTEQMGLLTAETEIV